MAAADIWRNALAILAGRTTAGGTYIADFSVLIVGPAFTYIGLHTSAVHAR